MHPTFVSRLLVTVLALSFGAAAFAQAWQYPIDLAVGADGTVFVADLKYHGIWKLKDGQSSSLVQGTSKFKTPLNAIRCVLVTPSGQLLAGDSATREVYRVSDTGELTPLTRGWVGIPTTMAVVGETLYVTDLEVSRVWKLPLAGLEDGKEPEEFCVVDGPRGICADKDGNIWLASSQAPQLQKFSPDGKPTVIVKDFAFEFTHQVIVKDDGTAFVSDGYGKAIWKVTPDGKCEKFAQGAPLDNPVGIKFQGDDILCIDPRANALFKITPDGKIAKLHPAE